MKHILTSMGIGIVLGAGMTYHVMRTQPTNAARVVAQQQWCDLPPAHTIPYISAAECGGGSSCDRAELLPTLDARKQIDWTALCRKFGR
jgi:hypothetical protein